MRKNKSLTIISEDNLINKIIRSLKSFLRFKQEEKEEVINRRALVIEEQKIERKIKKDITISDLNQMEQNISKDITYINNLDEDELNSLDEYYDGRIKELESVLNDKKSQVFKMVSQSRRA